MINHFKTCPICNIPAGKIPRDYDMMDVVFSCFDKTMNQPHFRFGKDRDKIFEQVETPKYCLVFRDNSVKIYKRTSYRGYEKICELKADISYSQLDSDEKITEIIQNIKILG